MSKHIQNQFFLYILTICKKLQEGSVVLFSPAFALGCQFRFNLSESSNVFQIDFYTTQAAHDTSRHQKINLMANHLFLLVTSSDSTCLNQQKYVNLELNNACAKGRFQHISELVMWN
ncbi:Hypothetical_protein [Hexamita inflata]|uniref:Hypothetical_protein n=1 Tax=Hexamita inflata TaxID=28002 RepID=A0AA86RMV5_9EUKA|nr:Hypothetical protein HINF_LOCUS62452 [Hexamita inflata]